MTTQYDQQTEDSQSTDSQSKQQPSPSQSQSQYDSRFLEQVFGGNQIRSDAVMQVLAHFDQMEQQARTARQTVWGLSLILKENTSALISALPPIVASKVADELRRQGLSQQR